MSVKYAVINASASGNNTIISAVTGKKIRVLGYTHTASTAVIVTWKSGTTTAISGPMHFATDGSRQGISGAGTFMAEYGVMETAVGEALVISLSGVATVGGHLIYREVQV